MFAIANGNLNANPIGLLRRAVPRIVVRIVPKSTIVAPIVVAQRGVVEISSIEAQTFSQGANHGNWEGNCKSKSKTVKGGRLTLEKIAKETLIHESMDTLIEELDEQDKEVRNNSFPLENMVKKQIETNKQFSTYRLSDNRKITKDGRNEEPANNNEAVSSPSQGNIDNSFRYIFKIMP